MSNEGILSIVLYDQSRLIPHTDEAKETMREIESVELIISPQQLIVLRNMLDNHIKNLENKIGCIAETIKKMDKKEEVDSKIYG